MTEFSIEYQKSLRQSTIGMILRCPQQYNLLQTHGRMPPGIAALSGSSVHAAAEYNHIQKVGSGKDEPLSVLKDCADQSFRDRLYNEGVYILEEERPFLRRIIEDGRQRTMTCTEAYHRHVAPKIQPVAEFTEKEIIVDVGLDMMLGGKLDTANAEDHIWDLKTSVSKYQKEYIKKAIQPVHYSLIYQKLTNKYPTFHVSVLVENGEHQPLEDTKTEKDFERHILTCKMVLRVIKSGIFPPCNPDPRLSFFCAPKWCGWHSLCKYSP